MNHAAKVAMPSTKSVKNNSDLPLPENESEPTNRDTIKMYGLMPVIRLSDVVCISSI